MSDSPKIHNLPDRPDARPPKKQPLGAVPVLSPPSWLEGWMVNQTVPVALETVQTQLDRWKPHCQPADPKIVAAMLDKTLAIYGLPANWNEIAEFYLEVFENAPLDLVTKSLKHVRLTSKFFPKPSELLEPIEKELNRRRLTVSRLEMVLETGKFDEHHENPGMED